jgi:nicotinamidase-related amidase
MPHVPPRLVKERSVLVVIDMQERFRELISGMPRVLGRCSRLIRFCQRLGVPILVTEHYPTGLGATLSELRQLFPDFHALEKISFSCAGDAGFQAALLATSSSSAASSRTSASTRRPATCCARRCRWSWPATPSPRARTRTACSD